MAEYPLYKNYSAADFERYYNGQMSAQEMHALEKAAMEDPFLADALEGYVHTKTPVKDVAVLKEKLIAKETKGKVVGIGWNNTFLRIAALFILIAGFGWATYQLVFTGKKAVAINTEIPIENKSATIDAKAYDTTLKSAEDGLLSNEINEERTLNSTTAKNTKTKKPLQAKKIDNDLNNITAGIAFTQQDTTNVYAETVAALPAAKSRNARSNISDNVLKGKVVDNKNAPVPFASVTNKQNNITVQTDEKGNFSLPVKDTVADVIVNSVGYQTNRAFLAPQQSGVKITLQEDNNSLSEVVITGYGTNAKKRENRFVVENAEPAEGWTTFNKYVVDQLEAPEDDEIKTKKGEVKLSFDVAENGEARNIKVEKSLCSKCDETAIRIVKEGTKWLKGKKKKKATVKIKF